MKKYLFILLAASSSLYAETFNVSTTSEFRVALNTAAINGEDDTINLAEGTYKTTDDGNGTFIYLSNESSSLTLIGSGSENVILSGESETGIISFRSSVIQSQKVNLENISFLDGKNLDRGAGIYSTLTLDIKGCIFKFNSSEIGAAIYADSLTMQSSKFIGNSLNGLANNNQNHGSAIYSASLVIEDSLFDSNVGGEVIHTQHNSYADINISNSIFTNNVGELLWTSYAINISDSIFTDNIVTETATRGISITAGNAYNSRSSSIRNSIFVNSGSIGLYSKQALVVGSLFKHSNIEFLYIDNNIYNSVFLSSNVSGYPGSPQGDIIFNIKNSYLDLSDFNGSGDLITESIVFDDIKLGFVDEANGDYNLTSASGLINAGTKDTGNFTLSDTDLHGNSRVSGSAIDIGPFEFQDTDNDGIANDEDTDDDNDGIADTIDAYPFVAIGDLPDTDNDGAPNDCDENCVALGMAADTDDDNDGLADATDTYPLVAIGDLLDNDNDGAPNDCDETCIALGMAEDTDDDGDLIVDTNDTCPLNSALSSVNDSTGDIELFQYCLSKEPSPKIHFELKLSGNFSSLQSVDLLYWLEDNEQHWITLMRDPSTGIFISNIELNQYVASGLYNVRAINLIDNQGIEVNLNEEQLNLLGFSTSVSFDNPNADNIKPLPKSLTTSGWRINEEGQPQINFSVAVEDNLSGVQDGIILELSSPTGASIQEFGTKTDTGTYSFDFVLNKYAGSGEYLINTIRLYDNAGNSNLSESWILENTEGYALTNPNSDSTLSSLSYINIDVKFDEQSDRPILMVDGLVMDDVSGVESVYLRLTRPSNGILDKWQELGLDGNKLNLTFSSEIALPQIYENGEYKIDYVRLTDFAANQTTLDKENIEQLNQSSVTSINLYYPDDDISSSYTVEASNGNDFVFGANRSDDYLLGLSGDDYIYAGDGDDHVVAGDGDDLVIGGSGQGNDTYEGDAGFDTLKYTSAEHPIIVNFQSGTASGVNIDNDTFNGFEKVIAGQSDDVIITDSNDNIVFGIDGDDVIVASAGADELNGGEGQDEFIFNDFSQSKLSRFTTIVDYQAEDILVINGYTSINSLDWGDNLNDSVVAITNENQLYFTSDGSDAYLITVLDINAKEDSFVLKLTGVSNQGELTVFNKSAKDNDEDGNYDQFDTDDDNDGIADANDAFPLDASESLDTDFDGVGNNGDNDDDNDGMPDTYEVANGLNPLDASDADLDNDSDGLINFEEFRIGTDINLADTDGDGINDNIDNNPLVFDEVDPTLYSGQFYTLPDMNADGVAEIGLLSVDVLESKVRLQILNGKDKASMNEIVWVDNFSDTTLSLHVIPDTNDNGFDEVGLFGIQDIQNNEGKPQVFVRDLKTGNKVGDVYNWVANWTEVSALVLDDMSGDGMSEIAIQGRFEEGNRPQLVVKTGGTNTILGTYSYPDLFVSPQYYQHSDINGDGFAEISTFGRISSNNKIQVKLASGIDAGSKKPAYNFPDNWDDVSWHRLDDSNGDGVDDWGMFGILREDGRPQLINKDGVSPVGALRIYAWPAEMQDAQFFRIPDMNNDGVDEVAAAGRRSNNGRYQFQVQDGTDRNSVLANHNLNLNLESVTYHVLPDLSGDEQVEIGFMGINSQSEYELVIRHGDTLNGEFATYNLGSDWQGAPAITSLGDTDDDGLPDLLVYGQDGDGQTLSIMPL